MIRKIWFLVLIGIIPLISATELQNSLHINTQVTDSLGTILPGTYNFTWVISNSSTATPVLFSQEFNLTVTDSNGIASFYLTNVTNNFSTQTFLCHYRDSVLINCSEIAKVPNAFLADQANTLRDVNNLNLSNHNITADTGFFRLAWSYLTNLPNIIYGLLTGGDNANNLLISNGTAIGYNQTVLNQSIMNVADNRYINEEGDVLRGDLNISSGVKIVDNTSNSFMKFNNGKIIFVLKR